MAKYLYPWVKNSIFEECAPQEMPLGYKFDGEGRT